LASHADPRTDPLAVFGLLGRGDRAFSSARDWDQVVAAEVADLASTMPFSRALDAWLTVERRESGLPRVQQF
jgi:hypothetical protein